MGWLINIAWLEDRFVLILFTIIRFGIYKSKRAHITELNLFVGLWKFDIKISLGKLKDVRIKTYGEVGRA
tara:strand:- start:7110 stop:7319 length:210 start_codon:yes stop_codon:yes gene_type:complete